MSKIFNNEITRRVGMLYDGDKQIALLEKSDGNYSLRGDAICKAVNLHDELVETLDIILRNLHTNKMTGNTLSEPEMDLGIRIIAEVLLKAKTQ